MFYFPRVHKNPCEHGYGFGQSLLEPKRLVFEPNRIVASGEDWRDEHDVDTDSLGTGRRDSASSIASTISSTFGDAGAAFPDRDNNGKTVVGGASAHELRIAEEGGVRTARLSPKWSRTGPKTPGAGRVSQSMETLGSARKSNDVEKQRRVTQPVYGVPVSVKLVWRINNINGCLLTVETLDYGNEDG
jgi:hypothetical protein